MTQHLTEVFEENSSELYSLAFLLTGNADGGVEAFDRALDFDESTALGDFMTAWARKLVIVEALETIKDELSISKEKVARAPEEEAGANAKLKRRAYISRREFEEAVIGIDAFPRCAMLLTIFEGMSPQAAAALLNADKKLVRKAQRVGIVGLTRNLAGDSGRDPYPEPGCNPVPVLSLG